MITKMLVLKVALILGLLTLVGGIEHSLFAEPLNLPNDLTPWSTFKDPENNDPPWKKVFDKNELQIFIRPWSDSDYIASKSSHIIHAPLEQVVAMIADVSSYDEWMENLKDFEVLERHPKEQYLIIYFRADLPWPFADRDMVQYIRYQQDPETKIVTFYGMAIDGGLPEKKGAIRIYEDISRGTIIPKKDGTTILIWEGHVEPGGWLPAWLVNSFIDETIRKTAKQIKMQVMKKKYQNIKVPWLQY